MIRLVTREFACPVYDEPLSFIQSVLRLAIHTSCNACALLLLELVSIARLLGLQVINLGCIGDEDAQDAAAALLHKSHDCHQLAGCSGVL